MPNVPIGPAGEAMLDISQASALMEVTRLMHALQAALIACDAGPLRVMIDSDGAMAILPLAGRPMNDGRRIVGIPSEMLRRYEGDPKSPLPLIVVEERS